MPTPKRILFLLQPRAITHLRPFLPIALWLRRLGHHVGFVAMAQEPVDHLRNFDDEIVQTRSEHPN